jgi:hypothetical protein
MLKQLAKGNTPTEVMSIKLQHLVTAIRSKAQREGISLRPVNRWKLEPLGGARPLINVCLPIGDVAF